MPDYDRLPLFCLETVLFPEMVLPLRIFEPRYRLMLVRCLERREPFGIVLLRSGSEVEGRSPQPAVPHRVGTIARIGRHEPLEDGGAHIEVVGETRFEIEEVFHDQPYLTGRVKPFWEQTTDPLDLQPLFDRVSSLFRGHLVRQFAGRKRHLSGLQLPQDPILLSFAVAAMLPVSPPEKQRLLATPFTDARLRRELEMLQAEQECDTAGVSPAGEGPADEAIVMPVDSAALRRYLSKN